MPNRPLISTKLHVPSPRRDVVVRPRLLRRLTDADHARVVLVSAPAGFGKTTLVAEWLTDSSGSIGRAVAWVSLDEHDDDPAGFWSYLVAGVDRAVPGSVAGTQALLASEGTPALDVVATFVNELHEIDRDIVLVLDDLHVVERPEIHEALALLVERLPARVRLVITSRADPPLPLARLRARGELVEVRAADLRFTTDEAAEYLNRAMGLGLTASDVQALEARTEGWIAALQLAALSVQGRDDASAFIDTFAGDDRFVVDYLVGEVLHRLPAAVERFLLHTSVLDRLEASLCDAVTAATDGRAMLTTLEHDNLFVVPLDDRREWYRYHHLFADVLRARLLADEPDAAGALHRRAGAWFAEHDDPVAAVRHFVAGDDFAAAAATAECAMPALRRTRQDATIREWARLLPDDLVRVRPVLAMGLVGAHMASGNLERADMRLAEIERWMALSPEARRAAGMVVVDDAQLRSVPGAIEMYRAALSLTRGDVSAAADHARHVLAIAPDDDTMGRAAAHALLGIAAWSEGDLDTAFSEYTAAVAGMRRVGHIADVLGCTIAMADIRVAQGRLRAAERLHEQGLALVAEHGAPLRGTADMHVGLAEILRERDERDAAAEQLRRAEALEVYGTPQYRYRSLAVRAGLLLADGDTEGCLALLDEAERVYDTDYSPAVRPVGARRARTYVRRGDLRAARSWADERGLSTEDEPRYVTEFEHITLAIIELADRPDDRRLQQVRTMLGRLLEAAEAGDRGSSVIEILAVLAMTLDAQGDRAGALATLGRAQELAAPEGYARVFAFLGPRLQALVEGGRPPARPASAMTTLVDPLSERELDVLRMLRSELSGPDIARELHVSLNTLRTHTKSIYSKLGVNSRREAVRRADDLGL